MLVLLVHIAGILQGKLQSTIKGLSMECCIMRSHMCYRLYCIMLCYQLCIRMYLTICLRMCHRIVCVVGCVVVCVVGCGCLKGMTPTPTPTHTHLVPKMNETIDSTMHYCVLLLPALDHCHGPTLHNNYMLLFVLFEKINHLH